MAVPIRILMAVPIRILMAVPIRLHERAEGEAGRLPFRILF